MKPEIQNVLSVLETDPTHAKALANLAALTEAGSTGPLDGPARAALVAALKLHRERDNILLTLKLLDYQLAISQAPAEQADTLVEKGRVLLEDLWRVDEAGACFRRALELQPGHAGATEAAAKAAREAEKWSDIARKYVDEIAASSERQLTSALYVSLAELYGKHQPGAAEIETYLRKALESDPRNRRGAVHLERLLRAKERWEELATLLGQRVEVTVAKEERGLILMALCDLQREALQRPDLAFATLLRASTIDPLNPRALRMLADAYNADGDWQSLVKLYESALKARPRGEAEQGILIQLGMLWWRKLGNMESAEEQFRKVRQKEPTHPLAIEFYRNYYGEKKEPAKLLQVLGQAQKLETDEKRRLNLAIEIARMAETAGGGPEKAIDTWKAVLKVERTNAEAVGALKRLYQGSEKWNALLDLLKEQVEALPKEPEFVDRRVEGLLELVAIYRDKLGLDMMVVNTFNAILAIKPDHVGALAALAAKYEALGRWNDLIKILQRQAEVSTVVEEKAALLRRVATLWVEKFGNHNEAVKPLEDLYALVPDDADVVARLRDIYNKRRAWRSLLDLEQKQLTRLSGTQKRAKLIEMAKISERLGDAGESISLWNRILEGNNADPEALAALAGLYEREKRFAALIEILARQRAAITDPKVAVPLLEKIGSLWAERMLSTENAVAAFQEILKLVPAHPKTVKVLRDLFAQAGDLDRLEALYAEAGHWEELCDTLGAVAERAEGKEAKLKVYRRVAEIAQGRLGQPERAARAFEKILDVDPDNLDAARALVPIYRAAEKWPRTLSAYEILLHHVGGPEERQGLLKDIRVLCEEKLGDKRLAFSWCAKAFATRPEDAELEAELERLARQAGAGDDLAAIYTDQLAALPDGDRKVRRLRQVAALHEELKHSGEARRFWGEVLARVPGDEQALGALERNLSEAGAWTELQAIYRQRVASAASRDERLDWLFKIARLEEDKLGLKEQAAVTYRAILEEDAGSVRALQAQERIFAATGDWPKLVDVLERQLTLLGGNPEAEAAVSYRLGELHETKLGAPAQALDSYRRAFAASPGHKETIAALERCLVEGNPARVEVARLLAPVYERADETQKLVDALRVQLAATHDRDEEIGLLRQLAGLVARKLGDVEGAFGYATRLFELQPADADVRRELAEISDLLDNHEELARRLLAAEEKVAGADPHLARDLAWERGALLEQKLFRAEDAEKAYLRVLGYDERHEEALRALERIYAGAERFAELRSLLVRRKGLAGTMDEKCELLLQISGLDEEVLHDQAAAAADYLELLDVDPASQKAFKALERIYTATQKWHDLDQLLGRAVPYAGTDERAQLKSRRGQLHAAKLDDPTGACDLFEEALSEDPRCATARAGLEALMPLAALRQRVARVLEPHYEKDGDWAKLVGALQAQREKADGPEAVSLLGRMAVIEEEKLSSQERAFAVWREALLLDPTDDGARKHVERLAVLLEKFRDLAEAWEAAEKKADSHDLSLRAELLEKAASLWDLDLNDGDRARSAWRRLLELDPGNLATARPAARALERLYQAKEAWPELIDILRRQVDWADGVDVKKDLLRRIGVIQEDFTQDYESAIRTYREILDLDAEDRPALDALERLHGAQDQWADLIAILRRRVELSPTPKERRDLRWQIADLSEKRLALPLESRELVEAYTAVLDENAEDVPALDALARLHEKAGRSTDLLDTLERRLTIGGTVAERVALRARIAALLEGPLGRRDQALDRYREIVLEDPDNEAARRGLERMLDDPDLRLQAGEILEPLYEGAGDDERLIRLCEMWAEHAPDPRDRINRYRRIAALRGKGGDPRRAFEALASACRLAVAEAELPALLDEIEKVAAEARLKAELVALYRELGADILDSRVQERVHLVVAVEARGLGDRATAREYFRRVLDGAPDHAAALDALEALYLEGRELEPLLEIYNRRSDLALGDDDRRRKYLRLAARLCEGDLARPADAIAYYEQILGVFPTDGETATALEKLYTDNRRFAELADLLERRIGFTDEVKEVVKLYFRLGEIYEKELNDPDRAVENYRSALDGDAAHAGTIAALERFLDDPTHRVSAAEVLEQVYSARHDWRSLIRIYEIRLEATDDSAARLALTRRIARAYEEQLEDLEAAFQWSGRLFREDPANKGFRDQLARLANILDWQAQLAEIYDKFLDETYEDTPAVIDVLRTVAHLHDTRLANVDKAKACYLRLLRINPADGQAFALLEALLTKAARWPELLDVYREAADGAGEPAKRKALLAKICRIQEELLHDNAAAIDSYRAILDVEPGDRGAKTALDRLFQAEKRWDDLVELLSSELERADRGGRVQIKLRLGEIFEKEVGDPAAAIDAFEEVLQLAPREERALAALERLVMNHDHRYRIAQILEPIYKAQDEWKKLVVIYDAELEFIDDRERRVELLKEIARLHGQRGGDVRLAFGALSRAWSEQAAEGEDAEAPIYQGLVEGAEELGTWGELVEVLEKAVKDAYDLDLVARVQGRVADIQERRLSNPEKAIEAWYKVVKAREDDVGGWRMLVRLLGQVGRPEELVKALERCAELSPDLAEQKDYAYRAADLYEHALGDQDKAIATWKQVLSLDDNDKFALAALVRLHRARGEWRELTAAYARQIDLAGNEAERRPVRFAMARVFEESLGDRTEAILAYRGVLEGDPRSIEALQALARLYEKEGQWPDLLEVLDGMAEIQPPGRERDVIRVCAAKVLEEKQAEMETAIDRYRQVLDDSPDNDLARQALEALVRRDELLEPAAAVLEPLYRSRGDYEPLIELLELKLNAEGDSANRRALLADIADLCETGLEDDGGAFRAWGRLLSEESADDDVYDQLERITAVRDCWPDLARLYELRLEAVYDTEVQRTLALKLAALYERHLGDEEKAVSRYRKALELGGDEMIPLRALDRLLAKARRWKELDEVIERESRTVAEVPEQAEQLFRLGELRRGEVGDLDGAIRAYREALERNPQHPGARAALEAMLGSDAEAPRAIEILEPLYEAEGDHRKRLALAEVRLRLTQDKAQRAVELQRMARVCEDEIGDRGGALDALVRALREAPDDGMLAEEIERLATPNRFEVAAQAFDQVIAGGARNDTVKDLAMRAARIYERLGDNDHAEERFVAVLRVDEENVEALLALDRIYRLGRRWPRLAEILDRRADLEPDASLKKMLLSEMARLRQAELGDESGAVAAWKRVLEVDEADRDALQALAGLHERAERWGDLAEVLEQLARFTEDRAERVTLKSAIAALFDEKLGNVERAIDAYRDLLDLDPESTSALDQLERLQAQKGDWMSVQEVLVRKQRLATGPAEQVKILRRLAEIAIQQQSPEDAIGHYGQAIELMPEAAESAQDLRALLAKLERWNDLIDALRQHAEKRAAAGDRAGEVGLLIEAAAVYDEKLQQREAATEVLGDVLRRDEQNVTALMTLARIHEGEGNLTACREALERAASASTGKQLGELHFRLGALAQKQDDPAAAEEHLRKALEADDGLEAAATALEAAVRKREDWAQVATLVARRSTRGDVAAQKATLLELSQIELRIGRRDEAIAALEKARGLAPEDAALLEPLADLYYAGDRLADAQAVYQGMLDRLGKGKRTKEVARLMYRVGQIAEKQGQKDQALTHYQAAYQIDAGHAPTLVALGRFYTEAADWEKARRIYRSLLLQNIDPAAGVNKADIYLALGEIHEKVNEAPKAVGMYERGLEVDANHAGLKEALARVRGPR